MAEGEEVFDQVRDPITTAEMLDELRQQTASHNLLMEVWGKWPGEESIEEILAALKG